MRKSLFLSSPEETMCSHRPFAPKACSLLNTQLSPIGDHWTQFSSAFNLKWSHLVELLCIPSFPMYKMHFPSETRSNYRRQTHLIEVWSTFYCNDFDSLFHIPQMNITQFSLRDPFSREKLIHWKIWYDILTLHMMQMATQCSRLWGNQPYMVSYLTLSAKPLATERDSPRGRSFQICLNKGSRSESLQNFGHIQTENPIWTSVLWSYLQRPGWNTNCKQFWWLGSLLSFSVLPCRPISSF